MVQERGQRHRPYEDALAMLLGTLFVALGITFYTEASLLTGSTAGLALLVQYSTGAGFGLVFFLINLPFYYLAIRRMGWLFTVKTFAAVLLVSLFSQLTPHWIAIENLHPLYAALMGGSLTGMGILVLFRHRMSLGGITILALFLQDRYGLRAGYVQLAVDAVILMAALVVIAPLQVVFSVLGALAMNQIVALNHRAGRYIGIS
ncbi:YitT family protein [Halomonas sp. McH1-25]|uniref:YitT family protein n=1 Tax=unclassified Halomonas TaxID=2609666 RepID=UPI001EF6B16A|nr:MULTISPECIES: YitT family protein [unclassified Halomonas]MCG7601697.1 YitT family protein [Halomonas sp. McH1-25]MCP1343310.1 YitT family protein [Halomonas sp. FL8]MCP1360674.1 YitT family protein [Halomonas sp. BBD45]MCP1365319.1 YitT family protein [Halomonas sp. BBD48]